MMPEDYTNYNEQQLDSYYRDYFGHGKTMQHSWQLYFKYIFATYSNKESLNDRIIEVSKLDISNMFSRFIEKYKYDYVRCIQKLYDNMLKDIDYTEDIKAITKALSNYLNKQEFSFQYTYKSEV